MKFIMSLALALAVCAVAAGETVRLPATADVWFSDCDDGDTLIDGKPKNERLCSMGKAKHFKLKSIQEMGAVRFDATAAKGRQIVKASLYLKRETLPGMIRYVRVSTVGQNWTEGATAEEYGPGNGSCYAYADAATKRPWSWPHSEFCDVIMTAGNTLATWAERKEHEDGWISIALTPDLIHALCLDDTDGLCIMDGGTLSLHNNFVHSSESKGNEPYIEVELGEALNATPAAPVVKAEAAPKYSHIGTGAIKVSIEEAKDVFCWRVTLNGKPVDRWRVRHPARQGATEFILEDIAGPKAELEVIAVSAGGQVSKAAKVGAAVSAPLTDNLELSKFAKPTGGAVPPDADGKMKAWPYPGLVKISPEKTEVLYKDESEGGDIKSANAVWDGKQIGLFGCRGEYVSYQLCIENLAADPLKGVAVKHASLSGPDGAAIGGAEIELYKNWYAQNKDKKWQPSYAVPLAAGATFEIPDPKRVGVAGFEKQQNQSVYVDIYIPKDAKPGSYAGTVSVEAEGVKAVSFPVTLTVHDFVLPDKLSFWPELNSYNIPGKALDYARLAHQHRCVLNLWTWTPRLQGAGKDIKVVWDDYDKSAGQLLSGEAFKGNRRAGMPQECMYLPYADSWPTPLSPANYAYKGRWFTTRKTAPDYKEGVKALDEHYLTSPYIGDALSQSYKDAFLAVQKQFIDHFKEKGWDKTEMQCFYQGKKTHRIDFGSNMWWTTDEPYHGDDWLALEFFCRLWVQGREASGGDKKIWFARGDISRPNWQGRVMEGILDTQYGGIGTPAGTKRMQILERDTGVKINDYGSANADATSNMGSIALLLNVWTAGGNAHLPWQTLGREESLDVGDGEHYGNALLCPGGRFGLPVVGDIRLKALREGQQIIEYLQILCDKRGLTREQVRAMVQKAMPFQAGRKAGAAADNADANVFSVLQAWQISELRRTLAELIVKGK